MAPENILIGTDEGAFAAGDDGSPAALAGRTVDGLVRSGGEMLAIAEGRDVVGGALEGEWRTLVALDEHEGRCLLAGQGELLVGTSEAHLLRFDGSVLATVAGFERAPGRERWFTPWGGPPATRSLARGPSGELYANVHVGGILRSDDGGESWRQTIEIEVDAHEIRAPAEHPALLLAATARGLAASRDGGERWDVADEGLRATYARAVALAGDVVLLSASDGPRGGHAGVYRRSLGADGAFERCRKGLPEWFADNITTGCLEAAGDFAAFGTGAGDVYASEDAGASWARVASGLPRIRCLTLVA